MSGANYLTPDELTALKETFRAQTVEMLEEFSRCALELERSNKRSEILRALERTVHTVKGDSMALEFEKLAKLAHRLEDYLRGLRQADRIDRAAIDLLLASGDCMGELLQAYCSAAASEPPDIEALCARLVPPLVSETREVALSGSLYRLSIWFARDCQMRSAGAFLVRQRLEAIARVVSSEPEPEGDAIEKARKWTLDVESDRDARELRRAARVPGVTSRVDIRHLGTVSKEADSDGEERRPASQGSDLLRVEVSRIDRIMNLVGELVIGRSMLAQVLSELDSVGSNTAAVARLSEAHGFLDRTLTELQAAVLKIRMVPVEQVFKRFPRLVRDLAHSRRKRVELVVEGAMTELDKSIVDALGEPLLHLVRNAIDHGLEGPEERERAGKPAVGRLLLSAFYEGNHAHVIVEDDGRGIDAYEVARRAESLGLLQEAELDSMSPAEILNTIYRPGFSTRETVSDVSGRGIGMDVVRESIEKLKGVIELETAPGKGTRFLMRLPLTLAILRAVLVEVAGRAFAVPLTAVLEIVRLTPTDAKSVLGRDVLHWRNQVVPLVRLRDALDFPEASTTEGRVCAGFVLLVGEAERRVGLVAERLLGEQELVVKPIEDSLSRSPGIAGASILGNGRVVLILHTRGLLDDRAGLTREVEVLH